MPARVFTRDVALKVTSKCRQYRMVAVSSRNIVSETLTRHELLPPQGNTASIFDTSAGVIVPQLANTVTLANMWASLLNQEERVRVEFHGEHATPTAESLALGETRAFLQPAREEGAMQGSMRVHRILYGHQQPFVSTTVAPGTDPAAVNLWQQATHHAAQSDGVASACFFATAFDPYTALPTYSTGLLVQPIAPSESRTKETMEVIGSLQRAFQQLQQDAAEDDDGGDADLGDGITVSQATEISTDDVHAVRRAMHRRFEMGWAPHDLLALGSGDWAGAGRVAEAARYCGGTTAQRLMPRQLDASELSAMMAEYADDSPYRGLLGDGAVKDPKTRAVRCDDGLPQWCGFDKGSHGTGMIELDETTLVKTPLDFFCRCTRRGFMDALRAVGREGVELRRAADPDMKFRCAHCARDWQLEPADWDEVLRSLSAAA